MDARFGMVGLGTMGRNFVLNVADHGFKVCGYDRDENQRKTMQTAAENRPVLTVASSSELVAQLATPRIIMLLVPAGKVVDLVLDELVPLLGRGDIVIDGGNSHYTDTERRYKALQDSGIHFIGMGVSGGEEGARYGASMMPGGNLESYELIREIMEAVAARADDAPCVAYMGQGAAGHYVKMVHNGIEYAVMQMISEVYGLLRAEGLDNEQLHQLFREWNQGPLASFLLEITADIFLEKDLETGAYLLDKILDKAQQKGTGLWTTQSALELSVPTPTIDISVTMRYLSALKQERVQLAALYPPTTVPTHPDSSALKDQCRDALYFGFLMAYGQGLELLEAASEAFHYGIDIPSVIKIWRAGCIIRSELLGDLYEAFTAQPGLKNIIGADVFVSVLNEKKAGTAAFINRSMAVAVPVPALASTLNYFNAYIREKLPANLIQAQRDYFGAHTYERTDREGSFHTDWNPDA
ncbi:NADP-dependent phosphogluconate dehydrogenase [Niabella terrae]